MNVSIVVPCHNAAPYLAQTVESALGQTIPPREVLIVDDGSTDGSLQTALACETRWPGRVRVFAERSGRAARTRNLGALAATGDALLFLDADDIIAPATIEALADALRGAPAGLAICPWYRLEHHDGRWISRPPTCAPRAAGDPPLNAWLRGWYHPPCAVLWSREAFEQTGRWDELATTNDDGDLMMRALALGIPLRETTGGAAYYRRRADGMPSLSETRRSREALEDRIRIIRKIGRWVEDRKALPRHRDALCDAFYLIAADAGDIQPDLRDCAYACARRYAPPFWIRVKRRLAAVLSRRGARGDRRRPRGRARQDAGATGMRAGIPAHPRVRRLRHESPAGATVAGGPAPSRVRCLERPHVSVIIPTWNRATLLRRAIDSVRAQSYGDFELLVVDDASTDDTPEVVASRADGRVRHLRQPRNAGVAAARNRGMREARGDLIAFLDSDDEWLPGKLARQVALFASLPGQVGLVYTGVENVREDGRITIVRPEGRGHIYARMLARNLLHGAPSSGMIRRAVVATAGFFDEGLPAIEDYEYWLRVTRFFEVEAIDEPLVRYHDPRGELRRSLALRANLQARSRVYHAYAGEMRQARAAHLFLLKSARRALTAAQPDVPAACRLAARAVIEAPTSRLALTGLAQTLATGAALTIRGSRE